ncbi:MAG TPA: hypothetical protein VMC81_08175 [Rhodocyclaceae bacterium]|nr:hypothetical protein [Rhodocyclaceae bacterium]
MTQHGVHGVVSLALRAEAPAKPSHGEACNGCGICCAMEPCPVAWFLLRIDGGACPALEWQGERRRYACGMARNPAHHLRWLPRRFEPAAARFFMRRIAAGTGCDCDATEVRTADHEG